MGHNNTPKEQLIEMARKSALVSKKRLLERIEKYNKEPNKCKECGKILDYEHRSNKFCCSSCAATHNNLKRRTQNMEENRTCMHCGKLLSKRRNEPWQAYNRRMFCSNECKWNHDRAEYIKKWKNGEIDGMVGEDLSERIRKYLIDKVNNKCSICGWSEVNKHTGKVPLEIHHKDGNPYNNIEENLQVLCPNCHSLTATYRKNSGNGRQKRRERRNKC